ncbi:MAG: hypothetical protein AABY93_06560 [Bacteroidota bacterium]
MVFFVELNRTKSFKNETNILLDCGFILSNFLCFAQQAESNELVSFKSSDSIETVNIVVLLGRWYNTESSVTVLQPDGSNSGIISPNKSNFIEIEGGGKLTIRDNWTEDYGNSLKNSKWIITGNRLIFQSPELGKLPISFTRDSDKRTYHMYCNGFTYTRKIQLR